MTTTRLSLLPFSVSIALPLRMPCVTIATTSCAPFPIKVSAALTKVPHVSAMSSTRMAMRSWTSPTRTMRETSLGRGRSLWIRAKPTSRRSAREVALGWVGQLLFLFDRGICSSGDNVSEGAIRNTVLPRQHQD